MSAIGQAPQPIPTRPADGGLQAAGIGAAEERLYRALLRHPRASLAQLAASAGTSPARARRGVDRLASMGLLSRQGSPARFVAAAPDIAVDALILRRQEELERCRMAAAALLPEYREGRQHADGLVEVIVGWEATHQRSVQLLRAARHEVLMFDKPPYLTPLDNPVELEALARGVAWRAIYAPEALAIPERSDPLRAWQQAGEQARVCAQVPLKLLIADRSLALLPLAADGDDQPEYMAILVHPCSLLTTLGMLFDMLWERSLPFRWGGEPMAADGDLDKTDQTILQLLTAGFKDQAIARQLGLSVRTVRRRLGNLMAAHGLSSRFQLGQLALQRGWL